MLRVVVDVDVVDNRARRMVKGQENNRERERERKKSIYKFPNGRVHKQVPHNTPSHLTPPEQTHK